MKKTMLFNTAVKKANAGEFEFVYDAKIGINEIRYITPSSKVKYTNIELVHSAAFLADQIKATHSKSF